MKNRSPSKEGSMQLAVFSRAAVFATVPAMMAVFSAIGLSAHAAVPISFSGGSGSPLSMTLPYPVSYTITADHSPFHGPVFVFDSVGDLFGNSFPAVTGTISFSIDGGLPLALDYVNSGVFVGSISGDDIYASGPIGPIAIGSVVTLSAGTLTTNTNVAAAAPASGLYETRITSHNGLTMSTPGVAVPEPATLSLLVIASLACSLANADRPKICSRGRTRAC
jgi:hypothetical protein